MKILCLFVLACIVGWLLLCAANTGGETATKSVTPRIQWTR